MIMFLQNTPLGHLLNITPNHSNFKQAEEVTLEMR